MPFLHSYASDQNKILFKDIGLFDPKTTSKVSDMVLEKYGYSGRKIIPWENRAALRRVRKDYPHILFMVDTDGGDVGAHLYVHKTSGQIDSLIIDNEYFFDNNFE